MSIRLIRPGHRQTSLRRTLPCDDQTFARQRGISRSGLLRSRPTANPASSSVLRKLLLRAEHVVDFLSKRTATASWLGEVGALLTGTLGVHELIRADAVGALSGPAPSPAIGRSVSPSCSYRHLHDPRNGTLGSGRQLIRQSAKSSLFSSGSVERPQTLGELHGR